MLIHKCSYQKGYKHKLESINFIEGSQHLEGLMFYTCFITFILENENNFEKCFNNHNFWKVSEMDMIYDYNAVTTCTRIIGTADTDVESKCIVMNCFQI